MHTAKYWLDEISQARKREKTYRENGKDILAVYEDKKHTPFNILYSNTETLLPALFSDVPKPVVSRRYKDDDPLGKVVSETAQRMLEYLIDTDVDEYEKFEEAISDTVLDAILPGRGVTQIKYEAEIISEGEGDEAVERVKSETVCMDAKVWDRVLIGYAKKWKKVPWIAFEEYLDKDEAKRLFGELPKNVVFTEGEEKEDEEKDKDDEKKGKRETALFYQIWDKKSKQVIYVCPQEKKKVISTEDDPLGLTGFFPIPKPLQFFKKASDLCPIALYTLYKNQAEELNQIQMRLSRVIKAIKVRGTYNGSLGDELENILKEDDNGLVPTDKSAMLLEGGLDKNIWFMPIGELVAVAQQLYQARESCKTVIYEITGISDIVRGQSMASETLGAQKIKEQWGTMRLKRGQKQVQTYVLDAMKIMLEVAIKQFSVETWKSMTQLPFPTQEEKMAAQTMLQKIEAVNQQKQAIGMPPQPVDPKMMQVAQSPSWEEILGVLKDDYQRSYRLDIETNSTLDVEATEDKQLVGEFMNALAQYLNGVGPLIEKGILPFEASQSMMLAIVRRFRFGREVEDELKKMKPPQPPQDPKIQEAQKQLQQEQQKLAQEKQQFEQAKQQASFEDQLRKQEQDFQKKAAEMEIKAKEELSKMKIQMMEQETENSIKLAASAIEKKIQQMFDRQASRIEKMQAKQTQE